MEYLIQCPPYVVKIFILSYTQSLKSLINWMLIYLTFGNAKLLIIFRKFIETVFVCVFVLISHHIFCLISSLVTILQNKGISIELFNFFNGSNECTYSQVVRWRGVVPDCLFYEVAGQRWRRNWIELIKIELIHMDI